jgi:hypothetical protein
MMNLQPPPPAYSPADQAVLRDMLQAADQENRKRRADVDLSNGERLILKAADGGRWSVTVSDAGVLSATALP